MADILTFDSAPPVAALHGQMTETAYLLPEGLSYDEWASEVPLLARMVQSACFWWGDLIRYGERNYGEKYTQAIEASGLALQTLMNAVWVCERIEPDERRPGVTFSHHKAIAAVEAPEERAMLLDRAEREAMTVAEVRTVVRAIRPSPDPPALPPVIADAVMVVAEVLDGDRTLAEKVVDALVGAGYSLILG